MRKAFYLLSALAITFTACHKTPVVQQLPDPQPVAAFSRTINYTNRGTINGVAYNAAAVHESKASIHDNRLNIYFLATPRVNDFNTSGDAIAFQIDAANLQSGLTKTYFLKSGSTPAVLATRYTYTYMDADGDIWSSFHDSGTGLQFEGYLTIEKWDATRRLISGSYKAEIKKLIHDPTKHSIAQPIDPINQCDVTVEGTFSNVKIQ